MDDTVRERTWLGRLALGLVVIIAAVPIGLQVQVSSERAKTAQAESAQRRAERDEREARSRLASVDTRATTARAGEHEAQADLDRSRAAMTAQGLQEEALSDVQQATAKQVKDLRAQDAALTGAIAEQVRLQPVAGVCVFDLLRALGRVGVDHDGGPPSDACKTVAQR